MKNKFIALVWLVVSLPAFSQEGEFLFKVLASKGANKCLRTGNEEKPLVIGKKLLKGDKIVIAENGYSGLAFNSGKTIELKKAGTYEVDALVTEVKSQNAALSKKYIDFVVGEMTASTEDMSKNRHKYMAVTGSVERGKENIHLIAPVGKAETYVLPQPVIFKWNAAPATKEYIVSIDDMFDEHLYTAITPDTTTTLDLGRINAAKKEGLLILRVCSKDKPKEMHTSDFSLKFLDGDKEKNVLMKKEVLEAELGEENALNKLLMASFYEENKLLLDAMHNYEEAIRLQPDVDDFKAVYNQFLFRHGMASENVK